MKLTPEHIQQLLVEKISGTITAEDDLFIEQLLIENKQVCDQWRKIQQQIEQAEAKGFSIEGDVEKSWQQIELMKQTSRKKRVFSMVMMASAAAVFTAVGCIYLLNKNETALPLAAQPPARNTAPGITLSMDNGQVIDLKIGSVSSFQLGNITLNTNGKELSYTSLADSPGWSTLSVPATYDYKILLSDGTEVWMNSQTKLRFPFSFHGKTREVYVEGEAYFKVAKKQHQPFIVHTPKTHINVLGTQFNVNTYDGENIKTALVEGAVKTFINNKQINLKPGFEAVYNAHLQRFQLNSFDQSEVLSWMEGIYYFHNMPLKDLSGLLTRWYDVQVQFGNPALQDKTFSGELVKDQPVQLFLDNLKISNELNSDLKNGVVYFK